MPNLPKRRLKVFVGKRQRARRVRQFVDDHSYLNEDVDCANQTTNNVEVDPVVNFDLADASLVNSLENDVEFAEVESEDSNCSDSELDVISFDCEDFDLNPI